MHAHFRLVCIFIGLSLITSGLAIAATTAPLNGVLPSIVDPGIAGQRLSIEQNPLDNNTLTGNGPITIQPLKPGQEDSSVQFVLKKVMIKNNHFIAKKELKTIYSQYLGKNINLAGLQKIANEITNYYRSKGYILSKAFLPAQVIHDGVVVIQIVEGRISHVSLIGSPGSAKSQLERYEEQLSKQGVANIKSLERYLLLANDIPGLTVSSVLKPSETETGGSDLILATEFKKASLYASYDNYGTPYLGPEQITIGGQINSLLQSGDSTALRLASTQKTNELNFIELNHTTLLGSDGLNWLLGGNYARTNPGFLLEPFDLIGNNNMLFTNLSYPLVRSRALNWTPEASFQILNSKTTILSQPYYNDRIRYLGIRSNLSNIDGFRGSNSFNIELDQGLDILGASHNLHVSRLGAKPDFTKFQVQVSRIQMTESRLSLLLAAQAQLAFQTLYAAEQFSFGGPEFGRGYDPAEIVGDKGVAVKFELRVDTFPSLMNIASIQYYAFLDMGQVWNVNSAIQYATASATSSGLGARVAMNKYFSANLFVAKPLTLPAANEVALGENGNGFRGFFQIVANV